MDGRSKNKGGRPKGTTNLRSMELKEAFKNLLDLNTPNMVQWLERVAATDPGKALGICADFAEFCIPKLARTDLNGDMKLTFEPLVIKQSVE